MKRIPSILLACTGLFLLSVMAGPAWATPPINGTSLELRTFNDCPLSTLTTTNTYPSLVSITDVMDPLCVGFANLHSFSFSSDGGATSAPFENNSNFRWSADFNLSGAGEGEGGLRLSPWYGQFVDGRFMCNVTSGEIACFGGALPFYSFTGNHAITYVRGTTVRLEITYRANDVTSGSPATIQYSVKQGATTYSSPALLFGEGNTAECDPRSLWGMLNGGRTGGYFQPRANTGASLQAAWSNISYTELLADGTPVANGAAVATRIFNDCPLSVLTVVNSYPASVSITDAMDPLCIGFANLHGFSFSEDGGANAAAFDNNANYHFGADYSATGAGEGEGGLRISPWYGQNVDGRFMANATSGEIACFGGALPFYSFTGAHGITYVKGTTIRMEARYKANDLIAANPATIQYRVIQGTTTYDSPVLPFGQQNPTECNRGLWGELNDARVGGYFQPRANTGATLNNTWGNIRYAASCEDPVTVGLKLFPSVMNMHGHWPWVVAFITAPSGFSPNDIAGSSIRLNGVAPIPGGIFYIPGFFHLPPTLLVKFRRSEILPTVTSGNKVPMWISGNIKNTCFEGSTNIKLRAPHIHHPHDNDVLAAGSTSMVSWDTEDDQDVPLVSVLSTFDEGETWNVVAENVPNNGNYAWQVPSTMATRARIAIAYTQTVDDPEEVLNDVEVVESGNFSIATPTGVGEVDVAFAMRGIVPNPAFGSFTVNFTLPSAAPARIALFDISGRQVVARDLGSLGAGRHSIKLGETEKLAPGVYLVRLSQGRKTVTTRAVVAD